MKRSVLALWAALRDMLSTERIAKSMRRMARRLERMRRS